MTLEEVIRQEEELVVNLKYYNYDEGYVQRAKQILDWLKELKQYKDKENIYSPVV